MVVGFDRDGTDQSQTRRLIWKNPHHLNVESKSVMPIERGRHLRSPTFVSDHRDRSGPLGVGARSTHCAENARRNVARVPWSTPSRWHVSAFRDCPTPHIAHPLSRAS